MWGGGYKTARSVADAVLNADGGLGGKTLTTGFRGLMGTLVVSSCRCEADADGDTSAIDGTGRGEQWVRLSFVLAYVEQ
jgi:hypothetical protein